jgi:hypothetical protein
MTDLKKRASDAILASYKEALTHAKAIYRERAKNFIFVKNSQGEWSMMNKDWSGSIAAFAVPESYLSKCLHGDQPLSTIALKAIRDFIYEITSGSGMFDFRNSDGNGTPFDNWIKLHQSEGVRYAWRGDTVGGSGKNPSLDTILNGTHAGYQLTNKYGDDLIHRLATLGYVGIEYDGGTRVGGHTRGGGGELHRAFVFWDDNYINGCITEIKQAAPDNTEIDVVKKLSPKTMFKGFRDKL